MKNIHNVVSNRWKPWLICAILFLLLSACSNETEKGNEVQNDQRTLNEQDNADSLREKSAPREPVTLVFYSTANWTEEAFNERFGDAMRSGFPEYTIEYVRVGEGTTLPEMIASDADMDVYWQASDVAINDMKEYKLTRDMTGLATKHQVDLSLLEPSVLEDIRTQSDGMLYALPIVINTAGFFYNKEIFDRFGVDYPYDGITWEEVIALGERLNRVDGDKMYYGIGYHFNQVIDLNAFSIPYVDPGTEKPTILAEERWTILYDTLVNAARLTGDNQLHNHQKFIVEQEVGMLAALANLFLNIDMSGLDWDMVTYPTFQGQDPNIGPQAYPTYFGITSKSKHPEEAMEVLKHLLSVEVQLDLSKRGIIPVIQDETVMDAFGTGTDYGDKNLQAIIGRNFASMAARPSYGSTARSAYTGSARLLELIEGAKDRNTVFREIYEDAMQKIEVEKTK